MIYKCMNCGGNVVYDPQSGHMKCMSCGGSDCEQSIPSETPMICPACGTQITYRNEYGSAGKCPACGVPIIRDDFIVYPYGPDVILPFKVSKRDAEEKLKQERSCFCHLISCLQRHWSGFEESMFRSGCMILIQT